MAYINILFSALLLPALVHAANDWSKPCHEGRCSWDVPSSTGSSGGLTLHGSSNAISDITTAAGWNIIECTSDGTTTNVRLVCDSADTSTTGCGHLSQNGGAVNKLVRLPNECGSAPFARVASESVSSDQSIPPKTAARLRRRGNTKAQVKSLVLDTQWHKIPVSGNGQVSISISGANVPGADNISPSFSSRRRSRIMHSRRDISDDAIDSLSELLNNPSPRSDSETGLVRRFNDTQSTNFAPINVNQNFPLFNQSVTCGLFKAAVDISANTQASAQMNVGVIAVGTIVPPVLTDFQLVGGGSASLNGALNFVASVGGNFDSGALTLFTVGIPGFSIPNIFTLGPSFEIAARATANLNLDLTVNVPLSYQVQNLQVFFPPSSAHSSSAEAAPLESPIQLSVKPSAAASGKVAVNLTPTLNLGVQAFNNDVSATIFVNLNAGLSASVTGNVSTSAAASIGGSNTVSINSQISNNTLASGCITVAGTIAGNVGAQGSFFSVFSDGTTVPIFTQSFPILNDCVSSNGNTAPTAADRRRQILGKPGSTSTAASALSCPTSAILGSAQQIASQLSQLF